MSKLLAKIRALKKTRELTSQAAIRDRLEENIQARSGTQLGEDYARSIQLMGDRVLIKQKASGNTYAPMPTVDEAKKMAARTGLPWFDGYENRLGPVWSSDERVNRYGDIDLQVWELANYNKNPVVLLSHDWESVPVGSSISHETLERTDDNYVGPALRQVMLFAPGDANPVAESVNRLWQLKFLRTVSVAFYPGKVIDVEDNEDRASLGLGKWGMVYTDLELLEVSPCSIPALPSAHNSLLRSAEGKKLLRASDFEVMREVVRKEVNDTGARDRWKQLDANLRHIWEQSFPGTKFKEHSSPEIPVDMDATFTERSERDRFDEIKALVETLSTRVAAIEKRSQTASDSNRQARLAEIDRNLADVKLATGVPKS